MKQKVKMKSSALNNYIKNITFIVYFVMFAKSCPCFYSRRLSCCFLNNFLNSNFYGILLMLTEICPEMTQ